MKKKGSAIIWVVASLMIFTILVAGILIIVGGSHNTAMHNIYKQQAYFTALSVAEAAAYATIQEKDVIGNFVITPLPSQDMGTAKLVVTNVGKDGNGYERITIKATGTYKKVQDSVTIYLVGLESPDELETNWEVRGYGK